MENMLGIRMLQLSAHALMDREFEHENLSQLPYCENVLRK